MQKIILALALLTLIKPASAEDSTTAKNSTPDTTVTIGKEIKELSNKDIFGQYKKNIVPVKINEKSGKDENISIMYDMPRREIPSSTEENGKFKSALGFKVKDTDANDISTLVAHAYKAAISGQSEAALTLYKKALEKEPNNTNILFGIASLYQKLVQYKEAKIHYKKLLAVDPQYKKALNNYLVLMSEESPGQALTELKTLEAENHEFSPVQAQIGMIYAQMGDYATAEQYLKRAITLSPEVLQYRYNLAVIYDNMKKYHEAISVYKQIVESDATNEVLPQNSNAIRNRMTYLQEKLAIQRN